MNKILLEILAVVLLSACSSHRAPLTYFADADNAPPAQAGDYLIKIEPADELLITVNSEFPDATAEFNAMQVNPAVQGGSLTPSQPRQQTYVVDSQGDIMMPKLGRMHVQGMTTEQLQQKLTAEISEYVENPYVKVQLMNFVVNVAGEVKEPKRISVSTERYSVLDALTEGGDLTPYGERQNVMIVREEDGKRVAHRLDLNKAETLSSPYFYLKQNDYVYVEPSKVRKDNADYNQNNSYKLSVISTIVGGCSVLVSLIIALAVK